MMISSGGQVKISKNFKIVYNLLILFVILFVVGNIRISNIDNDYISGQFWRGRRMSAASAGVFASRRWFFLVSY